jgi:hypothetical protein
VRLSHLGGGGEWALLTAAWRYYIIVSDYFHDPLYAVKFAATNPVLVTTLENLLILKMSLYIQASVYWANRLHSNDNDYLVLMSSLCTFHFMSDTSQSETPLYRVFRRGWCLFVCSFVSMGVRGKPRVYCSLLAYCSARFGRSTFGHQMPRAYRTLAAEVGTYGRE